MKAGKILFTISLLCLTLPVAGQNTSTFTAEELTRFESKAGDITNFYFYLLNTLASNQTSSHEKEIIVTESYKKYFESENVQVEDDLDERREVPTNKNIAAYLKDVDFFFKNARFEYELKEITQHVNDSGKPYFKVALNRRLNAVTVQGDTLNNTQDRFIELNISSDDELRIASIYTTKLSEKEDLLNWWNELSYGWQEIFKEKASVEADSLNFDQLREVTLIKALDLRENEFINNIEPLSKLTSLERIDISNTSINDLSPLRNLTKITELNISNTNVDDLEALRYAFALKSLFIDNTPVDTIDIVNNLRNLQFFSLRGTMVTDLSPLKNRNQLLELYAADIPVETAEPLTNLSSLKVLDLSGTNIDSLPLLSGLKNLQLLNVSNTSIIHLAPVKELHQLEEIRFENTKVDNLDDLDSLNSLKKIYCDYTGITRTEAAAFMAANPGTLIIFASDRLSEWWKELSPEWRNALMRNRRIRNASSPSKEELAELTRMDSIDISGSNISDLAPLNIFHRINSLNLGNNNITSIELLKEFDQLETLNISHNPVEDITVLGQLAGLKKLNIDGIQVNSLSPFYSMKSMELLLADDTGLTDDSIRNYHQLNPEVLVVYKSGELKSWWDALDDDWQTIFRENTGFSGNPDPLALHKIIFLKAFTMNNRNVTDLEPLRMLLAPEQIVLNRIPVGDISVFEEKSSLIQLSLTGMPVSDLSPIARLTSLEKLNISDTPVEDLDFIGGLRNLQSVDLSNTQVKNLKQIVCLKELESLNVANTYVRKLKHLYNLEKLKELICYNTKVSPREVEKFKEARPECRVVYYR